MLTTHNVPGAMSSAKGRDFQKILSEIAQAEIPMPDYNKWANAGMVVCNGVSIAYRIIDAQFWGIPQRRRRVFALASFDRRRPVEILFERESLYRYLTPGGAPWERTAAYVKGCADNAVAILNDQGGDRLSVEKDGLSPTLRTETHGNLPVVTMRIRQGCEGGGKGPLLQTEKSGTLATGNDQILFDSVGINGNVAGTLDSNYFKGTGSRNGVEREVVLCAATGQSNAEILIDKSATLNCNCEQPIVCFKEENKAVGVHQNPNGQVTTADIAYTLTTAPNASARNAPLVAVHPDVFGTLCASGAGLSRPGGMGSEPDLCIVTKQNPNQPVCGTLCAKSIAPNGICNEADMCILQETPQTFTHLGYGQYAPSEKSKTILANDKAATSDIVTYCLQGNMIGRRDENGPQGSGINENVCFTLNGTDRPAVTSIDCRNFVENEEISGTLQSKAAGGYALNSQNPIRNGYIVRRLVPTEAERLMGFPDDWTAYGHDGKPICDTARYQALGNSIAVPCVAYVMAGIVAQLNKELEDEV